MSFELPSRGLVFWPVENGDSTTVVANRVGVPVRQ